MDYGEEQTSFLSEGLKLEGFLYSPKPKNAYFGVLFIHGGDNYLDNRYGVWQKYLAERGFSSFEIHAVIAIEEWKRHVFQCVHSWQQIKLLKNESDGFSSKDGQCVLAERRDFMPVNPVGAGVGCIEQADNVHEGRLP